MKSGKIFGAAGTGKTKELMRIMTKAYQRPEVGGDHSKLAFTTLTRAGRGEAARRASQEWGVPQKELEHAGFRTTHSIAMQALNISPSEILGSSAEDNVFFIKCFGVPVTQQVDEDGIVEFGGDKELARSLYVWNLARVRCCKIAHIYAELYSDGVDVPDLATILHNVRIYEDRKKKERRVDFTDMLERFAGVRSTTDGPVFCEPEGEPPQGIVGWMLDEAQDASRLLFMVWERLIKQPDTKWVWFAGDVHQAVNSWCGADFRLFQNRAVDEVKSLEKSFRNPAPILRLAHSSLRQIRGYVDRKIVPADHEGTVRQGHCLDEAVETVDARKNVLMLGRTNRIVDKIAAKLRHEGVPFRRGDEPPHAGVKDTGRAAALKLAAGDPITRDEAACLFSVLPAKSGDVEFYAPGLKKDWRRRYDLPARLSLADLTKAGFTEAMTTAIATGQWTRIDTKGRRFVDSVKRWGIDATLNPKVLISTIHSSKGLEADKVVLCTGTSRQCYLQQAEHGARFEEECRVAYVAITRARHELEIVPDLDSRFQMDVEL